MQRRLPRNASRSATSRFSRRLPPTAALALTRGLVGVAASQPTHRARPVPTPGGAVPDGPTRRGPPVAPAIAPGLVRTRPGRGPVLGAPGDKPPCPFPPPRLGAASRTSRALGRVPPAL